MHFKTGILAAATTKGATAFVVTALACGAGGVAATHATGSANPADWGNRAFAVVHGCKAGEHWEDATPSPHPSLAPRPTPSAHPSGSPSPGRSAEDRGKCVNDPDSSPKPSPRPTTSDQDKDHPRPSASPDRRDDSHSGHDTRPTPSDSPQSGFGGDHHNSGQAPTPRPTPHL